jgi:multidrug efflux pump subunit AcrB
MMGIAVTGGMLLSTLMTLYIVPAMYAMFSNKRPRGKQAHSR